MKPIVAMCGLLAAAGSLLSSTASAEPPRVFSVFAHGTGGHRNGRDLELITELGAAYWGRGANDDENAFYRSQYQKSFLILDGVGTTDMFTTRDGPQMIGLATHSVPRHAMPGDFIPDALEKLLKPLSERVSEMKLVELGNTKHRGDIFGDGWDDNVAHVLFTLKKLKDLGQFPDVVNCIGWSRGAVTCLKLSNAIHDYFVDGKPYRMPRDYTRRHTDDNMVVKYPALKRDELVPDTTVKTNLFLIDPVPGRFGPSGQSFGSRASTETLPPDELDYQHVPRTVARAIITLATDEQREGFAPLDASKVRVDDPSRSTVVWLPFPGIHRTQLRMEPRDPGDQPAVKEKLTSVPHVVWDLAWRFLTANGTLFERQVLANPKFGGRLRTNDELVSLYSDIWLLKEEYHAARNRGLMSRAQGGLAPRLFTGYPFAGREYSSANPIPVRHTRRDIATAELGVYVKSPGFFINEHHRATLERSHPKLFRYLTGAPAGDLRGDKRLVPEDVAAELSPARDAKLIEVLAKLGMSREGGKYVVSSGFRFGHDLGEPLHGDRAPPAARFTGLLERLGALQ